MRLTFWLVINLVLMFGLTACQKKSNVENTTTLMNAAQQTYANRVRAINAGKENSSSNEIHERYWAPAIRELKPIKVYTHRVNIVVVQKVRDNVEEGKYINIIISSYLPMDGVDGFTFQPNPQKGNQYHHGIFDYQRTINN
ncbi:MAG: hypothetical protein FVQ85_19905 [Planctomycetes bacterium]|nr:hypothetical protein [Planctomycetota bacterium]